MESKKINQLATELTPDLSDITIIGDPTTGISKKITLSQMASLFTGTVEEYANFAAFPLVGVADTIYIAKDTNVIYRWDSTAYVVLSPNIIASLVFNDANGFDGNIALVGSTATLTITTALTSGSVPFIGASGSLTQDNANLFFDDTNNRLGINTNAPTTALDIFGSGIIGRVNGTSTNNAYLGFASAGTNKWSIGNVQSDHRFRIYNEATTSELISVLQTGEFGIGIANPTTKLHIDGGASALIANLDADISIAKSISFRSDNSARINIEVSGTESGSNAGANFFIRRYSDAGSLIDTPLTITRSTGNAIFSGSVQFGTTSGYTFASEGGFFSKGGGNIYVANLLASAGTLKAIQIQRNDVEIFNIGLNASDSLAFINASGTSVANISSIGLATFSSGLTTNGVITNNLTNGSVLTRDNGTAQVEVNIRHSSTRNAVLSFTENGVADRWAIGTKPSDGTLYFSSAFDLSSPKFTLSSAGAATFSSSVTASSIIASSSSPIFRALFSPSPTYFTDYATNGITINGLNQTFSIMGGNVGVGITPSSWASGWSALQVGTSSLHNTGSFSQLSNNIYFDGSNYRYINTAGAVRIGMNTDGEFFVGSAPSGSAGSIATINTRLSINGSSGAATFLSTVQSKGIVVVGASGGYTSGDNTYINLGGAAAVDNFGAINAPFGDKIKLNAYHGFDFKTSNGGASGTPVTMFTINISGQLFSVPTYNNTTGAAVNMYIDPSGIIARSTSSLKYKKDVINYDKGLAEVMQMRSVYYKGISEMDGNKQFAGLIAEEVHELGLTEFVQYADDGTPDALAYQNMVSILVKAIQEQQGQIEELKQKIK